MKVCDCVQTQGSIVGLVGLWLVDWLVRLLFVVLSTPPSSSVTT